MLVTTLIVAVAGALLNAFIGTTLDAFLIDQTRAGLIRQTRLAALYVAEHHDRQTPHRIAAFIGDHLQVRVTIVDSDGTVVGDSRIRANDLSRLENHGQRPEVLEARAGGFGRSIRYSETLGIDMLYVAGAVPGHAGMVLRLAIPKAELNAAADTVSGALWLSLLAGLAVTIVIAYVGSRVLTRQIRSLTQVVGGMAAGDVDERTEVGSSSTPEIRALVGAVNDLRLRTQTQIQEILVENSRLEAVLASISEGIMVTERNGRIRMTNRQFDRLFGVGDVETAGRMPIEVVRSADVQEAVTETLRTAEGRVLQVPLPGVLERHLDVHVAPIVQGGACIGSVTVFYDISEIRRLEQIRKDFVANVSHELRTPLTSIKGCAETLADGALDDGEAARRFVDAINAHADRLHHLVDDLLDLSHLESDAPAIERQVLDVGEVVSSAQETVRTQADGKEVAIVYEVGDGIRALGDPNLIRQAVTNLLDNAIKYTEPGGTVTVRARVGARTDGAAGVPFASPEPAPGPFHDRGEGEQDVERVCLEVSDTGIGIPSENLPRVFERFYRVDRGRTRATGGTGLGLAIVRHIVEAHGERVYVRSELGKGSTFGFSLPLSRATEGDAVVHPEFTSP